MKRTFGDRRVFFDVGGSLELGRQWSSSIDQALEACRVTLVVIGPSWVRMLRERAHDADNDVVLREVSRALELLDTDRRRRVISVRVGGADLPALGDLPERLHRLIAHQGASVRGVDQGVGGRVNDTAIEGGDKRTVDIDALAHSLPVWTTRRRRFVGTSIATAAAVMTATVAATVWPQAQPARVPVTVAVTASAGAPDARLDALAQSLRQEVDERGASTQIAVLPPGDVGRLDENDPEAVGDAEATLAGEDVQALIAVIETADPFGLRQSSVELFLAATTNQLAPELAGRHVLLEPIAGDLSRDGIWRAVEAAVRERGGGLVDLLQALASFEVGDLDAADSSLDSAAPFGGDSEIAALIALFAGTIDVRRADLGERVALDAALVHYDEALRLRPGYERAVIGRAQVRFLGSVGDECEAGADVPQLEGIVTELAPLRSGGREPEADIEYKAALLRGRVMTCLGLATREGTLGPAAAEFTHVIDAFGSGERPSLSETAQLAYAGRAFLYLSAPSPDRALALADLDAAIALTTDVVRLCDTFRLQRIALGGVDDQGETLAEIEEKLSRCPT